VRASVDEAPSTFFEFLKTNSICALINAGNSIRAPMRIVLPATLESSEWVCTSSSSTWW